ncbi:leucine/isoleucine/valine transporter ATP-binding subunit [Bradyrhizobium sp. LTSPM299]|uniref:ABC transporter ATP-binding protein n=1 Tax=Bradyrhizobium sp. LTSPM299 TaxID=1619233 RepID=UPI0005CA31E6|nr:ABC transporter ATP-binding protein [Bradyrhizobium sp. LTSPM299]KJC62217.1 leucine/isoleucine/valine transporter ATP-binding subunit [Bradyrhizobium sp. LTSPM299]
MAEAPDTPCLAVNGLVTGYDARNVLTGVSLSLKSGELVTVVGPNGHGKSTLLRAISGLLPVRKGSVSLNGKLISGLPAHRVAANGVIHVPQGDLLFSGMSVLENLLMGAYLDSDRAAVAKRLDEVFNLLPKLAERQRQIAASLSGGERRMVGIGRGLMMKGTVMLIDEPSLGLAPIIIEQIYEVITRLKASGRTILLVEENPARVADIADRIHLLDNGAFVWSGEPAVLLERDELLATYLGG